ncbi:DUF1294 domain-containing protein [Shewanella sediminis]|nr:DUF1294 domain-containing protein [Shewanella sediminis]
MRTKLTKPPRHRSSLGLLFILGFSMLIATALFQQMLPYHIAPFYLIVSGFTFIAYALDKSAARKGNWRTKESTLQLMALIGGWPGALLAQRWLRHKSQKMSFRITLWLMIALNNGTLLWLLSSKGQTLLHQVKLL